MYSTRSLEIVEDCFFFESKTMVNVTLTVCCSKCGQLDKLTMNAWTAASNFLQGRCHEALPDSHSKLRGLLSARSNGFNSYSRTLCCELADVEYATAECEGVIAVSLEGLEGLEALGDAKSGLDNFTKNVFGLWS
ncbi:unnamed protein product [Amoebophrya sp. A25]|nr:unnamed protein product [Amoebophrya sp. A25]|eukprot:GSA25T00026225001.1